MKVAIVIGHGPKIDEGAVNKDGTTELDWNTDLAYAIMRHLDDVDGVIVKRNIERLQPVLETNATKADLAIELHLNDSATNKASGTEMIHYANSKKGKRLAEMLLVAAVGVLNLPNRGVKTPVNGRGERWLKGTTMPAVIVESFFIDNNSDLAVGNKKKEALAKAYAMAIEEYAKTLPSR